jgi:hypothetical protein
MDCEIDHVFICVSAGAPEAQALVQFGLVEGSADRHQGARNRQSPLFLPQRDVGTLVGI